jgi:ankyrin repeat protein
MGKNQYKFKLALLSAIQREDADYLKRLLAGGDVNYIDHNNLQQPLILAIKKANYGICRLLLDNKADVNLQDHHKVTPLLSALLEYGTLQSYKHIRIVLLLLKAGADLDAPDANGQSARAILQILGYSVDRHYLVKGF